ncbi:MAG: hypothetical protein DRP61_06090 [Candidatus Omnitrophota bacterium]|nr:MAG: hypothetical protein DRP61_06090 [Candidatus Omnitrophota bacterium]
MERRRFLRISVSLPLKFKKIRYVTKEGSISKDLNIQGIRFLSQEFLPVSTNIKVEIKLHKDKEPLRFIAKTLWIKSRSENLYEVGAKIIEISKEDVKILSELNFKDI